MRTFIIIIGFVFSLTFSSCATRVVVQSPNAKIVRVAPKKHKIVVIKGKRFYLWKADTTRKL